MDNPIFFDDEDIPPIDDGDYDNSLYDTSDTTIIKETSFTLDIEEPAVRLRQTQKQRLLGKRIVDIYKYLDANPGNVNLVNTKLFKYKESES